ncbi:MAG: hypothetical protein H6704_25480 [Myxococcales bacterium]|nr:hypothetical protein [Myxococcales bacterium]
MHHARHLTRVLLLLTCPLTLPACSPSDAEPAAHDDGGGGAPAPSPADPDRPTAAPFEVRFDGYHGDYDVAADGTVPYVWGWQGGTMIQPRVDFPDDAGWAEGDRVRVRFRVEPEPGGPVDILPSARETVVDMSLYDGAEGPLSTSSIELQLGWEALDGLRLRLRVDIEGIDHVFDRTVVLALERPAQALACEGLAEGLGGPGCVYADLPAQVTIDALEPADPDADPCAVIDYTVRGRFAPQAVARACFDTAPITGLFEGEQAVTLRASAACLDQNHIFLGGTLPVRAHVMLQGTCNPLPELTVNARADDCACD